MRSDLKKNFTYRITNANKTQLITILYEMIICYLGDAEECLDNKDYTQFDLNISRTQNCIDELIHSLNLNYELGQNLLSLYLFEKKELISFQVKKDKEILRHALKTFDELHRVYQYLEKQDTSEPVMTNAQQVITGLTYNKYNMQVDISAYDSNRGFKA
ncbi:MAG: flagellar protein FliS [Butyrivibrio sp.]|nr:flagellar protein FliS [Butyrivibrio sp.]